MINLREIVGEIGHHHQHGAISRMIETAANRAHHAAANIVFHQTQPALSRSDNLLDDRNGVVLVEVVNDERPKMRTDLRCNFLPQCGKVRAFVVNGDDQRQFNGQLADIQSSTVRTETFSPDSRPPPISTASGTQIWPTSIVPRSNQDDLVQQLASSEVVASKPSSFVALLTSGERS